MGAATRENTKQNTSLQLVAGIVFGGFGVAVLLRTGVSIESLSCLGVVGSFLVGLVLGVADYVEPLRRGFERGRWLIVGVAVFALLVIVLTESVTLSLLTSLILGLGGGVLLSTVGIAVSQRAAS